MRRFTIRALLIAVGIAAAITSWAIIPSRGTIIFILGNIFFSFLGLALGYFLLVQFRPDMNFLKLNVPIVDNITVSKTPDSWPSIYWDPSKPYAPAKAIAEGVVDEDA